MIWLLLLVLLAAEDPLKFTIEGNVVSSTTGEPLRRAGIMLQGSGVQAGPGGAFTADSGGHFIIPDLAPGNYALSAEKQGYAHSAPVHVAVGPSHSDIAIPLTPLSRIVGKVVDDSGDPILNANIQLFRAAVQSGRRVILPAAVAMTNDLGEYHTASLPAGRYFVSVTAQPDADGSAYPRTFYGGGTDMASASPVELSPGGSETANLTLRPVRSFDVRGAIANLPEGMHPYLNIARKGSVVAANEGHATRVDAETGAFEFRGVTPGAWVVTAGCFERGAQLFGTAEVVVSDSDAEGLNVSLAHAVEIAGSVHAESGAGAPFDPRSVHISLRPAGDGGQAAMSAQVREDATFTEPGVQPGTYVAAVRVQEPWYVKSVRLGGQDVMQIPFTVTASGAPGTLQVEVAAGGGKIEGTVVDGIAPVLRGIVLLLGNGPERVSGIDAAGKFHFSSLPAGNYTAYAFPAIDDIEYTNPDVMQRFTGTRISVSEGATQQAELKLNRTVY